jgi:hypothetical protein
MDINSRESRLILLDELFRIISTIFHHLVIIVSFGKLLTPSAFSFSVLLAGSDIATLDHAKDVMQDTRVPMFRF